MFVTNDSKNESERAFSADQTVQVLSLDGGGLKGLFTASVIDSMEQQLGHSISEHFDIVTGTSTGGLIAIALGLGISGSEIRRFYLREGDKIFPSKGPLGVLRSCRAWVMPKYSNRALRTVLQELLEDDDGTQPILKDSELRLVIPTVMAGSSTPRLLKTPHASRYKYDWRLPMWAVGMATSAAPTYFPIFQHDGRSYLDGGLWANNPSLIGVVEALDLGASLANIRLLNIGTTFTAAQGSYMSFLGGLIRLRRAGRLSWALRILPTVMQANSYASTNMIVHQLLESGNMFSINPQVADGRFALDRVNSIELTELGSTAGEKCFSSLSSYFDHHRHPYAPNEQAFSE